MSSKIESLTDLEQLSEDYSKMCLQDKYSDVTLVVADEKIPAHKNVLAARSCYFEETFDESASDEILLEVSNIEAFKIILQYIYTGCIAVGHLELTTFLTILGLAQQYFLNSLEEFLTKLVKTKCNIENVVTILNFARANQIQHLIDDCETFLDANSNDMLAHESFFLFSEESVVGILRRDSFFAPELDIFKAVAKWSQDSFEKAKKVVKYVRLSLIKPVDIAEIVRPSGIIDDGVLLSAISDSLTGINVAIKRAFKVIDKDVASAEMGAKFLSGEVNSIDNYRYHTILKPIEPSFVGIMVELKEITFINNIRMLLWGNDDKNAIYDYYIQVSTDQEHWTKVIDYTEYWCRSLQDLYFKECAVKYINIVGTRSHNSSNEFRLAHLEAYCRATIPRTFKSIIYATYNVASLEKGAVIWKGDNNACLDGNYTNYNETEGYSSGSDIWIRLAQPYMVSYIKFLLMDCDNRSYNFEIDTFSPVQSIINKPEGEHRSWQTFFFDERPVHAIRITSTKDSEPLRIVHFECMYKSPGERNILKGQKEAVSSKDLRGQEAAPE